MLVNHCAINTSFLVCYFKLASKICFNEVVMASNATSDDRALLPANAVLTLLEDIARALRSHSCVTNWNGVYYLKPPSQRPVLDDKDCDAEEFSCGARLSKMMLRFDFDTPWIE